MDLSTKFADFELQGESKSDIKPNPETDKIFNDLFKDDFESSVNDKQDTKTEADLEEINFNDVQKNHHEESGLDSDTIFKNLFADDFVEDGDKQSEDKNIAAGVEKGNQELIPDRIEIDNSETQENDYPSTYKERLDQTPRNDGERGEWTGERGESKFIPNDKEISDILAQYGTDGIEYQNAIPDFSNYSVCTVEIDNMTEKRRGNGGNFEQCDEKCAEQWNKECRDEKNDWTARDVQKWREANKYSWHEQNDMKTCDLILNKINDYFGHLGGVGECNRRDKKSDFGGEFDE